MSAFLPLPFPRLPGIPTLGRVALLCALACGAGGALRADGPKPADRGDALSPEERARLHEVLSRAWTDPEVAAAREEVHRATEAYRKTLRDAVARIDPEAVPVMAKLHERSRVEAMRHQMPKDFFPPPWLGPPLPQDPAAAVDSLAMTEVRLRDLSGPDRERFLQLAGKIRDGKSLDAELNQFRTALDKGGREGFKARRDLRERFLQEMRNDPWAAALLATEPVPNAGRPPRDRDKAVAPQ